MNTSRETTSTQTNDRFDNVVIDAMREIYGYTPHPFQLKTISRIIRMKYNATEPDRQVQPTLLVQGTGGGKSSVYQTIGCIQSGVHLIIQNTLSLSSDQLLKAQQIPIPNVYTIQLDSLKTSSQRNALIEALDQFKYGNSNMTLFVFSSPEALLLPKWISIFTKLQERSILKCITIDEVHLFVMYGITFRYDFLKLKDAFFSKVLYSASTTNALKIPILVMTATFNLLSKCSSALANASVKHEFENSTRKTQKRTELRLR